jgi:DNA-binding response OmpR family regulator
VNILLVEDHEDTREVLSSLLTYCGHEVLTAATVQDALTLIGRFPFEILVCDIGLPDGSGIELVAEAKRYQTWKKTVALTGKDQIEDRELGLQGGFDEYLTKPFDFYQLRSLLAEVP